MRTGSFSSKIFKPNFIYPVSWLIISTILLTLPGSAFPKENWLEKIWFDKWVHIGMFAIMVFLWCWSVLRLNYGIEKLKNIFLVIAIVWLLYGTGMEFVQKYYIANRSFDAGDILADGVGCLIGLLYSWKRYIKN